MTAEKNSWEDGGTVFLQKRRLKELVSLLPYQTYMWSGKWLITFHFVLHKIIFAEIWIKSWIYNNKDDGFFFF